MTNTIKPEDVNPEDNDDVNVSDPETTNAIGPTPPPPIVGPRPDDR